MNIESVPNDGRDRRAANTASRRVEIDGSSTHDHRLLKAPTSRKLRNRGLKPMRYHMRVKADVHHWIEEYRHGAIIKVGRTKVLVFLVGLGFKRFEISEMRYMKEIEA